MKRSALACLILVSSFVVACSAPSKAPARDAGDRDEANGLASPRTIRKESLVAVHR